MIVLIVLLYLICFFLIIVSNNKKKNVLKNKKNRVKKCKEKLLFFCSKASNLYKTYLKLKDNYIVFKSQQDFDKYVCPLKKAGIDYKKNIYKVECYKNFNAKKKIKELKTLKKLQDFGLSFYIFVFYDNNTTFNEILKSINSLKLKEEIKIFYCLDVDYNLLSSINFFDVNFLNNVDKNIKSNNFHFAKKQYKVKKQDILYFFNENFVKNSDFFAKVNEDFIDLSKYNFIDNKLFFKNNFKNCTFEISKIFNYQFNCEIIKCEVQNNNNYNVEIDFYERNDKKYKNKKNVFVLTQKNKNSFFENKTTNEFCLYSNCPLSLYFANKDYFTYSKVKLFSNSKKTIYFVKKYFNLLNNNIENHFDYLNNNKNINDNFNFLSSNSKNIENCFDFFNDKNCFNDIFDKTLNLYIKKIEVKSNNYNIDYLINYYLPKKIIKNKLLNLKQYNKNFDDFVCLTFDEKLIDKNLIDTKNIQLLYLKNNPYKIYFNLLYFYFGFFIGKNNSIILNNDRSLIIDNSLYIIKEGNKEITVNNKKKNLNNEIEIDGIKYFNLKSLKMDNFLSNDKKMVEINY